MIYLKNNWRFWIFWAFVIGFTWFIISRFTEIKNLFDVISHGNLIYIFLAVCLQLLYYLTFTLIYKYSYETVSIRFKFKELFPIVFASIFVNVVAPTGGVSGLALFVNNAVRKGNTLARSTAGAVIATISDLTIFFLILSSAIIFLSLNKELKVTYIVSSAILLSIILFLIFIIISSIFNPGLLERVFIFFQKFINFFRRIFRKKILAQDWAKTHIKEFNEATGAIKSNWYSVIKMLTATVASFVINIFSLYIIFLAFGYPVDNGVLIAGFAIGILFWIVSITPQGIGIVEGAMALAFASLGVPIATATVVALSFRGLTFWLPLMIGFFTLRRSVVSKHKLIRNQWSELWSVRVAAMLTLIMGLDNIISALVPPFASHYHRIRGFIPLGVRHGGRLTIALAGFALLYLGIHIWRRKRAAWLLALATLIISGVGYLAKGLDYTDAALAFAIAGLLAIWAPHFHARSDTPKIKQGIKFLLGSIAFTLAYGTIGFYILDSHFRIHFGLCPALKQTLIMFFEFYNPGLEPITGFGRYFADSIYIIGITTVGYSILVLLKPILIRQETTPDEFNRAKTIIQNYGKTPLASFALFDDKYYFFSSGGSVVAFVVKGGIAISLGDPIGPSKDAKKSILEFVKYCTRNGWQPSFYQTLPDNLPYYKKIGLSSLQIGSEAIVDLSQFSLDGGEGRRLRKIYNRFRNEGYKTEFYSPPLSKKLVEELRVISDEWLTMMRGEEKKFSLGWFDDEYIKNSKVALVCSADNSVAGFVNLVPEFTKNELSFDLMRRRPEAESGTMEFLFINLLLWAKEKKYESFNFGLSTLSGVGKVHTDKRIEKTLRFISTHFNQFYNFKGLHLFKTKFHPDWSPRYLIYHGLVNLPAVATSIFQADSGDDYIWNYLKDYLISLKSRFPRE